MKLLSHGTEIGGSRIYGYTFILYLYRCVVISFLAITVGTYLSWYIIYFAWLCWETS